MARRKLNQRDATDWEALIISARRDSAHTARWGCLDKKGKLFTIYDFKNRYVPMSVIDGMVRAGRLRLTDDGFYNYIQPKQKHKRRKLLVDR